MAAFLGGAALLVAFGALMLAANVANKVDEKPLQKAIKTIDKIDVALKASEQAQQDLAAEVELLKEKVASLDGVEQSALTSRTASASTPFAPGSDA